MGYQKLTLSAPTRWGDVTAGILDPLLAALLATGHFTLEDYLSDPAHTTWYFKIAHTSGRRILFSLSNYFNYLGYSFGIRKTDDSGNLYVNGEGNYLNWAFPVTATFNLIWSADMVLLTDKNDNDTNYFCFSKDTFGAWYFYGSFTSKLYKAGSDASAGSFVFSTVSEKSSSEQLVVYPALVKDPSSAKIVAQMANIFSCPTLPANLAVYQSLDGSYSWYISNKIFRGI